MQESGRSELSQRLSRLAKRLSESDLDDGQPSGVPNQPGKIETERAQELFEAGFSLIDVRQHELAAMLLNRCASIVPDEPIVNYELGFALMASKQFEQAANYFERSVQNSQDFDTYLNLIACYSMMRRLDDATKMIGKAEKLEPDQEQAYELAHRKVVVRRLASLASKVDLSPRDWLYALYGSILLRSERAGERQGGKEDLVSIASTLAILKGVMEGLRINFEVVEFFGAQSRPLAQAMAELFEIPVGAYNGPDRAEQALLTLTWASDLIGPHRVFLENAEPRSIFSYALSWNEPLPVIPEVIGCLSYEDPMPWNELTLENDNGSSLFGIQEFKGEIEQKYKAILDNARDLESDPGILHAVQEALDFYTGKRDLLVLNNANAFPRRSEYTAEVPS
jgi:tetratricopeptide (TPR) repeat protein